MTRKPHQQASLSPRRLSLDAFALLGLVALLLRAGTATAQLGAPLTLNANAGMDSGIDEYCQVTTDGSGTWVAVWESNDALGGTLGTDYDVLTARSTDGGATWSAPTALNMDAVSDSGEDTHPQVATDGSGTWVAVWESVGNIGTDYDIVIARSSDGGVTWSAPAALNTNADVDHGMDVFPQVTTDRQGVWVATWWTRDSLGGTIGAEGDIAFARSLDGGATWTAPAALNTNAASDLEADQVPQITTDGSGTWIAVWQSYDTLGNTIGFDVDILMARSTDGGATWSAPTALNTNAATDSGDDFFPQITSDGVGTWVAVWFSTDSLGHTIGWDVDILTARSTDGGVTWSTPAALNTNAATDSGDDYSPQVTTDGNGTWIATWTSYDTLGGTVGSDSDILLARSTDGGATWTAPEPLATNAADDSGFDGNPQVTTDGAGTWVAVWESGDDLGATIGTDADILYTRIGTSAPVATPTVAPTPMPTDVPSALCASVPLSGCRKPTAPLRSTIILKSHGAEDSLTWTWTKGATTSKVDFGNPVSTTDYAVCVYDRTDGSPRLASATGIAAGVTCGGKSCWKSTSHGFKFNDGRVALTLKEGMKSNAKIAFRTQRMGVAMPSLPLDQAAAMTVQLVNDQGTCWDADYSSPAVTNKPLQFRDKSD